MDKKESPSISIRIMWVIILPIIFLVLYSLGNHIISIEPYVLLVIAIFILLFLTYAKWRKLIDDKLIHILLIVLITPIPVYLGLAFLDKADSISVPSSEEHRISIFGDSKQYYVYGFRLYFNFESDTGNITFRSDAEGLNSTHRLMILLYENSNITKITIKGRNNYVSGIDYGYDLSGSGSKNGINDVAGITFNFSDIYDMPEIVIDFSGKMNPNGHYHLSIDALGVRGFKETMIFDMGTFSCNKCWNVVSNANINVDMKTAQMSVTPPKDHADGRFEQDFYLNTVNQTQERLRFLWSNLGIGILSGSVILFVEGVILYIIYLIDIMLAIIENVSQYVSRYNISSRFKETERQKPFFCNICNRKHYSWSNIGKEHLKYN